MRFISYHQMVVLIQDSLFKGNLPFVFQITVIEKLLSRLMAGVQCDGEPLFIQDFTVLDAFFPLLPRDRRNPFCQEIHTRQPVSWRHDDTTGADTVQAGNLQKCFLEWECHDSQIIKEYRLIGGIQY